MTNKGTKGNFPFTVTYRAGVTYTERKNRETFQHYTAPIQRNLEPDDRLYSCENYKALNLCIRVRSVSALKHYLGQLSYPRRGKS